MQRKRGKREGEEKGRWRRAKKEGVGRGAPPPVRDRYRESIIRANTTGHRHYRSTEVSSWRGLERRRNGREMKERLEGIIRERMEGEIRERMEEI